MRLVFSNPMTVRAALAGAAAAFVPISAANNAPRARLEQMRYHAAAWDWTARAARMAGRPVLVLTSDDGLASTGRSGSGGRGDPAPTLVHMATDHSYDDRRVELAAAVSRWLGQHFPPR